MRWGKASQNHAIAHQPIQLARIQNIGVRLGQHALREKTSGGITLEGLIYGFWDTLVYYMSDSL